VGLDASITELLDVLTGLRIHVEAARTEADFGTAEPIQKHVTGTLILLRDAWNPPLEQRVAGHSELGSGSGALTCVIGLHRALGDAAISVVGDGLSHEEVELTGLVAARRDTGAVIPPDTELWTVEKSGEVFHRVQGEVYGVTLISGGARGAW